LGFWDKNKVNLFELPSSDINMESFRNHSSDLATLTLDETLELLHDGTKLRIIAVMDISHGGDAVLAHPSVKNLSDIKGKRVSIVNIPLGLYMLSRTLDIAGVGREEVSVFPMSESKQENFYLQGKADVVITFEPVKTKLIKDGAHVIFDSTQIPNEIFDLLLIHEDVYQERRDEVCQVVKGWFKALDYLKNQPKEAALRISKRLGVSADDMAAMMDGIILPSPEDNKHILGGEKPGLILPAQRLAEILVKEKLISSMVDVSMAIDSSFASCY
jgi:NitT/TauT family transport system substrate-binding protein